jgi:drug/metabolite transporter (DMT)-like permease
MALWLIVTIFAYFFFALSSLGDKLVLAGPPKASTYTFYVGLLSVLVVVLIPFANLNIPKSETIFWIVLTSVVHLIGIYMMFLAVEKFEVSKVITTIGATQPVFIFGLTWIFFGAQEMNAINMLAFALLLLGSIIISLESRREKLNGYLKIVLISSVMFSLDYVFQKKLFLDQTFLQGLIWMRLTLFVLALVFLFSKKTRDGIFFRRKEKIDKTTSIIFLSAQGAGGLANVLQSLAIFLVPIYFLPIVNSLRGIQYVFLFLMTLFFTLFLPKILKEKISKQIIAQKIVSTILIGIGFWLLVAS